MKTQIVKIDGKFVVETVHGPMVFNSYADAANAIRLNKTLRTMRFNRHQ